MTLIDRNMPHPRLRQVDRLAVGAGPAEAWTAVRALDLYEIGLARTLFAIRLLPEAIFARLRGKAAPPRAEHARIEDFTGHGRPWQVLAEGPREVVVGAVGKFWQPQIAWAPIAPAEFAGFDRPGFGKVAWALRVDEREAGGSWIAVEVRVTATDDAAWKSFQPYWKVIGRFSHGLRTAFMGRLRSRLGPPAFRGALPGDDLLHEVRYERTQARIIEAPPAKVWPWLVQMGCGRAGWYAIDLLDNGGKPSADRIIPELQHIAPGDVLSASPKGPDGFAVLRIEPGRTLVLGSPDLLPGGRHWGSLGQMTWAFVLEPVGEDATHLVIRVRGEWQPSLRHAPQVVAVKLLHEVMGRAQLRHLKQRVEASA